LDKTQILKVLAVLVATHLSSVIVSSYLIRILTKRAFPEEIYKKIVVTSKIFIYIVGFFVLVYVMGVDLGSVVVGLGAASIAISFASSNRIQNLFSGILFLVELSIRVGDKIKINGQEGRVVRIGIRTTTMETEEGDTILIPNSMFMTKPLLRRRRRQQEKEGKQVVEQ